MFTINSKITIWKERKEKFEGDDVLDLAWENHCNVRSHIKIYDIPCQKLYQAKKVGPNKQMSSTRIEIIIGHPTSKCPLQESR